MSLLSSTAAFLTAGEGKAAGTRLAVPSQPEPAFIGSGGPTTTFQQPEARRHLEGYGGTQAIDWIYDGVRVYQNQAVKAKVEFKRDGKALVSERTLDTPSDAEDAPRELVELFKRPNPWQTFRELLDFLLIDILAVGNHYWFKFGDSAKPTSLYRLAPQYVSVKAGRDRLIERYEYQPPGVRTPIKIDPNAVVHFRLPNPHSPNSVLGMGVVQAAPRAYDIELGLLEAQASFFENGTMLAGALLSEKGVSPTLMQKVKREFRALYQGSSNFYNVAVLERGMKYQPIQPNAKEAAYKELSDQSRDRILTMLLGASKRLGGAQDDSTTLDEARRYFAEEIMRPLLDRLEERISLALTQAWGVDMNFNYGYVVPEAERLKLAGQFSTIPGVRVREVREKIGLPALGPEEKDEDGKLVDDTILNLPGPSTEEEGGTPDNLPGRSPLRPGDAGGRPAAAENVPAFKTKPKPSAADRARAARLAQKAVQSPDLLIAERLEEVGWSGGETEPAEAEKRNLAELVEEALIEGKALKKAERMRLVGRIESLPVWNQYRAVRERVVNAIAEGVRRGYTVDQILEGVNTEDYRPLRDLLAELEVSASG